MIKCYMEGKAVTTAQAKMVALKGYYRFSYSCPEEFNDVWGNLHTSEEGRDMIFEWSGYALEIFTLEEDEYLED